METLKIARRFSNTPGPRFKNEGQYSGEEFREKVLAPALNEAIRKNEKLLIDLDGTAGYGTSFLEEAFGGLIRQENMTLKQISRHVEYVSTEEPYLIDDIESYLKDAAKNSQVAV